MVSDNEMLSDDDFLCMQTLQALGLIPESDIEAELAFKRAVAGLKEVEDDLERRNKTDLEETERENETREQEGLKPRSPPKPLPPSMAFSLLRERINEVEIGGSDDTGIEDVRVAVAVGEIREVVRAVEDEIEESRTAPRRSDVLGLHP